MMSTKLRQNASSDEVVFLTVYHFNLFFRWKRFAVKTEFYIQLQTVFTSISPVNLLIDFYSHGQAYLSSDIKKEKTLSLKISDIVLLFIKLVWRLRRQKSFTRKKKYA